MIGRPADWGPVKAVLFDLDGTLIDSATDMGAATEEMRADRGLQPLPYAPYRRVAGSGARGMIGVAFGVTPQDAAFPALRDEFFRNYTQCMTQRTVAFEHVAALIEALRQRALVWGVVTNKAARFSEPITRAMPFFADAAVLISGDTTPYTKPHPAPLLEAMRRIAVRPQDCLYVGDDERDIIAGQAAGMRTVAAAYGYLGTNADTALWGASAVIHSPLDILQLLDPA